MMKMLSILVLLSMILFGSEIGLSGEKADQEVVYKSIGEVELKLHFFFPEGHQASDARPALVFFFGGGWITGTPEQFFPHAAHLAERGMVGVAAEYRVRKVHGTTPQECLKDAKSAIRWMRQHAGEYGVDPAKILAGGGSAGGHLAAATALIDGFEEEGEDLSVSTQPAALVLFNPVIDNGPGGFGHKAVKEYWETFSPLHNLDEDAPPTIVFLGTEDHIIPVVTAETYQVKMEELGVRSDLYLYEGKGHGFFNLSKDRTSYEETVAQMDSFLVSLGYLEPKAGAPVQKDPKRIPPKTAEDVSYGSHERHKFDFWKAESDEPTPLLIVIHGGGWFSGSKKRSGEGIQPLLDAGISCAAINYRLSKTDPLPAPVHDAARAVQYLRHHAEEWNIDPARIALRGGSAGGCSSLLLAFLDDLADPEAEDPVLRESSRVQGASVANAQCMIDPKVLEEWMGPLGIQHQMIHAAVGAESVEEMMEHYDQYQPLYQQYSSLNHVSPDDPPVLLGYGGDNSIPPRSVGHAIHHPKFGEEMAKKCDEMGVEWQSVAIKGSSSELPKDWKAFIIHILKNGEK